MEESVWMYFGVIVIILTMGIIITIFSTYEADSSKELLFDSVGQLARQADVVCAAPRDTQLAATISVPAGALLYTEADRICARIGEQVRCSPVACTLQEGMLINLTGTQLFTSHQYSCQVLHAATTQISCQG